MKKGLNLVYIIGTYPRLTMTFIDREINHLRQLGAVIQVMSIRQPDGALSEAQKSMIRDIIYLLPVPVLVFIWSHVRFALIRFSTYFGALFYLLTRPHPSLKDRYKTLLHFGEGVYAAYLMRNYPATHIHAHFVDRAATIALIMGRLLNLPYSVTAHANDIYVNPVLLRTKMGEAKFVATCTSYNEEHLSTLGGAELHQKLHCIYHGLDINNYHPASLKHNGVPPIIVSVGQLKEKKGFTYLIQACKILKAQGYIFNCEIVGEGPLRPQLEVEIEALLLTDTVTLCGAIPHNKVIEKYTQASIFVLPCVLSKNGDRDGIPNVILEAMAMGLPVVSTQHSGIPEVVADGQNGYLVPPEDATNLAKSLAKLLNDAAVGEQLGHNGRQTVVEKFAVEENVKRLYLEFIK